MDKAGRIKELIGILNEAGRAYYAGDKELMTNFEYDALYDELVALEEDMKEYLAGNLCRCSGYESQLRAVKEYLKFKMEGKA